MEGLDRLKYLSISFESHDPHRPYMYHQTIKQNVFT